MVKDLTNELLFVDFDGTIMGIPENGESPEFCSFNEELIDMLHEAVVERGARIVIVTSGTNSIYMHEFLFNLFGPDINNYNSQLLRGHFKHDNKKIEAYKKTAFKLLRILNECDHYLSVEKGFGAEEFQKYFGRQGDDSCEAWDKKDINNKKIYTPLFETERKFRLGTLYKFSNDPNNLLEKMANPNVRISVVGNDENDQFTAFKVETELQKKFPEKKVRVFNAAINGAFRAVERFAGTIMTWPEPLKNLKLMLKLHEQPNPNVAGEKGASGLQAVDNKEQEK